MEADWKDLEAIKRCKYKYMRCVDQKRWAELRECFTDDAETAYSGGKYAHQGVDAIVAWLEQSMGADSFHSSHRVHQPEIEFQDATHATGIWALEDTVIETRFGITIQGAAFYHDEYVKGDDGVWRMSKTGYDRTYEEMFPRASIEGLRLTASYWTTGGSSELDA